MNTGATMPSLDNADTNANAKGFRESGLVGFVQHDETAQTTRWVSCLICFTCLVVFTVSLC